MLPARHVLPWAKGLAFEPGYGTERSRITIRVNIHGENEGAVYAELIAWMKRNVLRGKESPELDRDEADKLWEAVSGQDHKSPSSIQNLLTTFFFQR